MSKLLVLALLLFSQATAALEPIKHIVYANGHPLAVWEKSAEQPRAQILLLHGRTWSSLPDFDLQVPGEDLSFMDGLLELGYRVYALDARGYGATARDASGWLTPNKAAKDVAETLAWIRARSDQDVHLFGWSYGSMVAQLVLQRDPALASSLILFGYPFDPKKYVADKDAVYPEQPPAKPNTAENAASDFITPGSISQEAIDTYVAESLAADPVRADFKDLHQWAELNAEAIRSPTLLLKGEFDPLAPIDQQVSFFAEIGFPDKWFVVLPGGDHAALLETPREKMLHSIDSFIRSLD